MDFYLSDLLGNSIFNQSREKIGVLTDVVITEINRPYPQIHGFVVKRGLNKQAVFIPQYEVDDIMDDRLRLLSDVVDLTPFVQRADEVLLTKDVYDKQIVDIDDRRLTRVNDLLLTYKEKQLFLKGVDVSSVGVLKRLNIPILPFLKPNIVAWEDVQFLGGPSPMKFKIQNKNLESLHPVDIARIIFEGPGYKQGSKVLSQLKDPIAADIIEELSPKLQKNLIESMKIEDVAGLIAHMSPDKAADVLVAMGPEYKQKILPILPPNERKEIEILLTYPEHTTGAFMTTDYLAVPAGITIEKLFRYLKEHKDAPDFMYYIFVLENEYSNRLIGVISNHDLFKADARDRIDTIMTKKIITTSAHESIKNTLKKMYRYNLSALPVVSSPGYKLLGIVTFRDAINAYLPKRWKTQINRLFTNGG
ncbi:MAG: CBS domain-containing protein [Patescibacteria group bacterium]